jgi:hypothetical protein
MFGPHLLMPGGCALGSLIRQLRKSPGDIIETVISSHRVGHVVVREKEPELIVVWVEGGGRPIVRATRPSLEEAAEWAIAGGAEGVVVLRMGDPRGYWWGPGEEIPFNKAELLPIAELISRRVSPSGWSEPMRIADRTLPGYIAYWADRAWSSRNPRADDRRRPLIAGELEELLDKIRCHDPDHADALVTLAGTEVEVSRYDMFLEGGLQLRGMIRQRQVAGFGIVVTDPEDAVNPNFYAGPPLELSSNS